MSHFWIFLENYFHTSCEWGHRILIFHILTEFLRWPNHLQMYHIEIQLIFTLPPSSSFKSSKNLRGASLFSALPSISLWTAWIAWWIFACSFCFSSQPFYISPLQLAKQSYGFEFVILSLCCCCCLYNFHL